MPMLTKPRHEKFAQAIVAGLPGSAAYKEAGFSAVGNAAEACASRLLSLAKVQARVAELQQRAAANVQVSREWVLERLVSNANRAMQVEEVKDANGEPTGQFKYEGSVANKALELVGKELGMFVDRQEFGLAGEFEALTMEQKRERANSLTRQLGITYRSPTSGTA